MKIAIHPTPDSFSERWIEYCRSNEISYKLVDCYGSDIMEQLSDCDGLMWHYSHNSERAILFAKELIFAIEGSGKKVFPDFHTVWHFDDKIGQKYLFEAISAPLAPSWVFYDKRSALEWIDRTDFPKVFKLRGGAGSQNVRLIHSAPEARKMVRKAFHRGFPSFDPVGSFKERWRRYKNRKSNLKDLGKGLVRFFILPKFARVRGRERGYIYFQEFIPDNSSDIRIIVVGEKAFGIKRIVRENDFRASGSGMILYEKEHFNDETVKLAFELSGQLQMQTAAFDFVFQNNQPYVLEVSYGFMKEGYDPCTGYWDKDMNWHEGSFNPYGWMVENLIKEINHA